MNKKHFHFFLFLLAFIFLPNVVRAHVTVKPSQVGIGERLNFSVSVPTEETAPTIQVRLVIPEGLSSVRPNVKAGWNVEIIKSGEGETERVSEIVWSGGSIPPDMRDEFMFSAQAPAAQGELTWKAYQTYQNDVVVAWDASPEIVSEYESSNPEQGPRDSSNAPKPYSVTKVVDDLSAHSTTPENSNGLTATSSIVTLIISVAALIVAVVAYKSAQGSAG